MKRYWEIIADKLSKAGWSLGWVSAIDSEGQTIWIADAHLRRRRAQRDVPTKKPLRRGATSQRRDIIGVMTCRR